MPLFPVPQYTLLDDYFKTMERLGEQQRQSVRDGHALAERMERKARAFRAAQEMHYVPPARGEDPFLFHEEKKPGLLRRFVRWLFSL